MLIVNKDFHDYYDTAMVYGVDKTIVYERKLQEVSSKELADKFYRKSITDIGELVPFVIGFCGEIIPFVAFYKLKKTWGGFCCDDEIEDLFYDADSFKDFIERNGIKLKPKNYYDKKSLMSKEGYSKFFTRNNWNFLEGLFHEYKTPIFLLKESENTYCSGKNNLIINPCLEECKFMRIYSPPETFQKIEMFISGVLGRTEIDNNIEVSEKVKLGQKGFNKWSFKKLPSKKR